LNRNVRTVALYLLVLAAIAYLVASYTNQGPTPAQLTTGQFYQALSSGRVVKATILASDQVIDGTFYASAADQAAKKTSQFSAPYIGDNAMADLTQKYPGIFNVDPQKPSVWVTIAVQLLPLLLIVGVMFFFMQSMQGGNSRVMSFGKAKAKRMTRDQPRVTFKDVAGVDEAVEELQEIKEFLENPGKFQALGAKIPKGVLLVGPPGTGKTLLARAVAGEAGVPFFSIAGSDFVEMFVGVGASRVRDLFEQAKAASPCIVFVDEIDAVGRHRGAGLGGGHDEREQTLNQLLVEMDGFDIKDNVILIAATNRPDILDPALLRPGRFDRQVVVDRPDLKGRIAILKVHIKGKPMNPDIDIEVLARRTPGFTGADLANLVNEAALLSARHGRKQIEMVELEEAIDRVVAGPERKSRIISDDEKKTIAYHESGHAIVGHVLPNCDIVHKVTIIPRGRSLGSTWHLPEEEKFLGSKSSMLDDLASLLGGRVAEEIALGDVTTGSSNDIERATKLARSMVTQYGMSDKLGPMTLGEPQHEVFLGRDFGATPDYSPEIAFEIDKEVRSLIDGAFERAKAILIEHRAQLDRMAQALIDRETLERDEVDALLEDRWDAYLEQEAVKNAAAEAAGEEPKPKRGRAKKADDAEAAVDQPPADAQPPLAPPASDAPPYAV
jgi:cell division protease FtsH